jgi:hypothetical protein
LQKELLDFYTYATRSWRDAMSMDDPGWGEEVPSEPPAEPGSSAVAKGQGRIFQPSRLMIIVGSAVVVVAIVAVALLVSGSKKPSGNPVPTTTVSHSHHTVTTHCVSGATGSSGNSGNSGPPTDSEDC